MQAIAPAVAPAPIPANGLLPSMVLQPTPVDFAMPGMPQPPRPAPAPELPPEVRALAAQGIQALFNSLAARLGGASGRKLQVCILAAALSQVKINSFYLHCSLALVNSHLLPARFVRRLRPQATGAIQSKALTQSEASRLFNLLTARLDCASGSQQQVRVCQGVARQNHCCACCCVCRASWCCSPSSPPGLAASAVIHKGRLAVAFLLSLPQLAGSGGARPVGAGCGPAAGRV